MSKFVNIFVYKLLNVSKCKTYKHKKVVYRLRKWYQKRDKPYIEIASNNILYIPSTGVTINSIGDIKQLQIDYYHTKSVFQICFQFKCYVGHSSFGLCTTLLWSENLFQFVFIKLLVGFLLHLLLSPPLIRHYNSWVGIACT